MGILFILAAIGIAQIGHNFDFLTDYSYQLQNPKIEYELRSNNEEDNKSIHYIPNMSSFSQLSFGNKFLDFSITVPNDDREEEDVDATQLVDVQLQGTRKKYQWELYYQNYHDLYINDHKKINDTLKTAHIHNYGFGVRYFLNNDYSAIESFGNNSAKKKTNWSWLTGFHHSRSKLRSSLGLIPSGYETQFEDLNGLTALEISSTQLEFGIASMMASDSLYFSSLFSIGMNYQDQSYDGIDAKNSQTTNGSFQVKFDLGSAIGKGHTVGLSLHVNSENIAVKNSTFIKARSLSSLYYKYYF